MALLCCSGSLAPNQGAPALLVVVSEAWHLQKLMLCNVELAEYYLRSNFMRTMLHARVGDRILQWYDGE